MFSPLRAFTKCVKQTRYYSFKDKFTVCLTRFLNAFLSDFHCLYNSQPHRYCTAASMLAGEFSFGSDNIFWIDRRIASTLIIGLHFSSSLSYPQLTTIYSYLNICCIKSSGMKNWDTHTAIHKYYTFRIQSSYVLFGCHIGLRKRIVGGLLGKSQGNTNSALKIPPSLLLNNIVYDY